MSCGYCFALINEFQCNGNIVRNIVDGIYFTAQFFRIGSPFIVSVLPTRSYGNICDLITDLVLGNYLTANVCGKSTLINIIEISFFIYTYGK